MLKHLSSHDEFISSLSDRIKVLPASDIRRLQFDPFDSTLLKVQLLNFDVIHPILTPLYSHTGRPADNQIEIFRSFILMNHFGFTSVNKWVLAAKADHLYAILAGYDPLYPAPLGSYYDFMKRLWHTTDLNKIFPKDHFKKNTPKKLPANGEKLDNVPSGKTLQLMHHYLDLVGTPDPDRPELILQELFTQLVLLPSIDRELIDADQAIISLDGSSLHIHSDHRGHPVDEQDSMRRYSDPHADWGWDSHEEKIYFGYSFFSISAYSSNLSIDLPLFFTIKPASQHDSVSLFPALAQFRSLCPSIKIKHLCADSAFDNKATFLLCKKWNITHVIDHNPRNTGKKQINDDITINEQGKPVCQAGYEMTYDGYCPSRNRHKYRCPHKTKKVDRCDCQDQCSKSPYGRTVYRKGSDDPRYLSELVYKSEKWKAIYKNRTSNERVNNRVLNNYHVEKMNMHTDARYTFFTMLACINIHLDAWIKASK